MQWYYLIVLFLQTALGCIRLWWNEDFGQQPAATIGLWGHQCRRLETKLWHDWWLVTGPRLRSPESLSHCQFLTSEDSTSYRRSGPQPDLCSGSWSQDQCSGWWPAPARAGCSGQTSVCLRPRETWSRAALLWGGCQAEGGDEMNGGIGGLSWRGLYLLHLLGVEWSSRQHTCEHGEIFSITFRNILWGLILKIANIFKNIKCLFTSEFRCWQNQLRPMASMPAGHCYAARWWPAPSVTWSCWPGGGTPGAGTGPIHPSVRWGQFKLHVASKSDKSYI